MSTVFLDYQDKYSQSMRKMASQAKDAVFLVLFLVCLNVIYNSITTDATTIDTSTTNTNTTPNPSNISCISDKFTSPFVLEDTLSISSVEESLSWSDQLSYSSMISNLDKFSSFSNLIGSEHSSISYTTCILLNSDNSRSSDLMVSEYSSIPYSATILSISDNPKSSVLIGSEFSSIPYTTTILSSSGTSTSLFIPEASFSISSEAVFQSWTDQLLHSSMMLSTQESSFSNNLMESEYTSIPYSETILTNSDNSTSSIILKPSLSISSEESSQLWIDQLSNSSMFLSTQEYSLVSNLIGSQYSSIQHAKTDLLKNPSSCILDSCNTSVHFLPTSAQSATYLISSRPTSTLQSEVSPSFKSITNTPFSSSQRSAIASDALTNLVTAPTSSTPASTLPSEVSPSFKSITNTQFSSSQRSAFPSVALTSLVTAPTSSTPTSTLPSEVSLSFKSITNTQLSSSQRSAFPSDALTSLVTAPTSSTPTSTLPSEVSPSFKSITNTQFSSSQRSAFPSVALTSLVTAPTSSTPTSTLPSEVSLSFKSITNTQLSSSQRSAFPSDALTSLVTAPTSSTPTSTLPSEVSPSFKSITNTQFSSSQRSAFPSVALTNLVTAPTSSTPTSTLPSEVSPSFKSITNTQLSSSQRSAFPSVALTSLVTAPTSSTPTSTLPSEVSLSFKSITNTPFSSSQRSALSSVTLTNLVTAPTSSTPIKQQTTSTVGETVIYPTFKPLAVYEFTFVFVLNGDFDTFKTSNQKDKLKEQLEKQLLEKIFKDTELTEIHVSSFSQGSIASHTACRGQVKNVNSVFRSLEVIRNNALANAGSINTAFGACDVKKTMENITSSINTYMAQPDKYIQYNCPKSYNYHEQDGECHHACEHKGIEFCGPNGECVFSGTENVAVCQCSEESLYIYHGDKCEQKTPKLTFYLAVSLGVGGGVVIILLITIICLVCRRIRLKKSLKAAYDDSEEWSLPNEHVAMRNLSFRLSKKTANLYYRPTGQLNKAYESIAPDEVIMPMYFPPKSISSNSRHEDDTESRRESLKNIDTSQKYSIRRPKVSMEPNDLFHSAKGPRI